VQFVFAGNDSEGLQYGTIGTPEKYFLKWKEDEQDNSRFKLDKYLLKMCEQGPADRADARFRPVRRRREEAAAPAPVFRHQGGAGACPQRKGGIIWHTQGSGKSIVMVLLAKWILENNPNARVAIITDRDELDKQIERVFTDAGETINRTSSGRDLMASWARPSRACCARWSTSSAAGRGRLRGLHQGPGRPSPAQTVGECSSLWTSATAPRAASCTG
jgi:type I restriction enzyme, R subunit